MDILIEPRTHEEALEARICPRSFDRRYYSFYAAFHFLPIQLCTPYGEVRWNCDQDNWRATYASLHYGLLMIHESVFTARSR